VVGLACAAAVAVIVPVLAGSLSNRTSGQPITGDNIQPTSAVQAALAFYQQRVAQHPNDVAARLDLADHELEAGAVPAAITQYEAALKLDPRNPEALATLGFLVATAGNAEQGLAFVQRALETDPTYPEGLYYEGAILLRYLHRPADAIAPLRAYLAAAPFGARRQAVQNLLDEAHAAEASPSPGASPSG
jgi:tetratricopeptide (TPR) repeat protein